MDHTSVITEHISGGSDRVSHRKCEIINVTLPMSDGEGAFLFCAPGYESGSHERSSMPKTKWGSVIFTAYKFFDSKELLFFVVLEDIHTEGFAAAQHSLQGNAALPRQSVRRRPFWRPAAGCRRHGRWCSSKTPSPCCAVCRRTSSPPTTMTMRDTSGRCWRRAACVPVAAPLWPPPPSGA